MLVKSEKVRLLTPALALPSTPAPGKAPEAGHSPPRAALPRASSQPHGTQVCPSLSVLNENIVSFKFAHIFTHVESLLEIIFPLSANFIFPALGTYEKLLYSTTLFLIYTYMKEIHPKVNRDALWAEQLQEFY